MSFKFISKITTKRSRISLVSTSLKSETEKFKKKKINKLETNLHVYLMTQIIQHELPEQ